MSNGNFKYFIRNLAKPHRLSMNDAAGNEVWYSHITVLKVAGIGLLTVVVVFAATLVVAAYTKILDIVPGYDGIRNREMMIENILRLDSLERELSYMSAYTDNVAQIMEGRAPVIRSLKPQDEDKIISEKSLVRPSAADSVLRTQMEGTGRYGLNTATPSGAKEKLKSMQLLTPVKGAVVRRFAPSSGSFGTSLEVADVQQVVAVQNGTVIMNILEPEGYTIQVQHSGDFISIYKGILQAHKSVGDKVGAGEAVGSTWSGDTTDAAAQEITIELWYDGTPLDPEKYIMF